MKVAKRFPKVKFSIVGGNRDESLPNVSGYDVKQAEIAYVAGAAAAMLSKNGAISYVGGLEIPSIVNAGKEFGNGAKSINPKIKYFDNYTGDFDDVAKSKEATLAAIAQGADVHYHILNLGLRGMEQAAKEKGTHIIGSYTDRCGTDPLYIGYSITGVGYQVRVRDRRRRSPAPGRPGYKPFGLAMGPKASGMAVCGGDAEQKAKKLEEIKKDILDGKIKVLEGLKACSSRPCRGRRSAGASAGGAAAVAARHVASASAACRRSPTSRSTSRPARSIACSARTAPASRRCATWSSASTGPTPARCAGAASRTGPPGPARRAGAGHRHGAPALQPGARHDGRREPDARPSAGVLRPQGLRRHASRRCRASTASPLDPGARIQDLSVGERQRVEIVKCLMREPAAAGARRADGRAAAGRDRGACSTSAQRVAARGCSVVLVTHKLAEIKKVARPRHRAARRPRGGAARRRRRSEIDRAGAGDDPARPRRPGRRARRRSHAALEPRPRPRSERRPDAPNPPATRRCRSTASPCATPRASPGSTNFTLDRQSRRDRRRRRRRGQRPERARRGARRHADADSEGRFFVGGTETDRRLAEGAHRRRASASCPRTGTRSAASPRMSLAENMYAQPPRRLHAASACSTARALRARGRRRLMQRFDVRAAGPDVAFAALSGGNQQKAVLGARDHQPRALASCSPRSRRAASTSARSRRSTARSAPPASAASASC